MDRVQKKKYKPIKADLKPIRCAVCELAATNAFKQQIQKRVDKKMWGEEDVEIIVENLCDANKDQGSWITSIDLSFDEAQKKLSVVAKDSIGHCKRECQTVAKACVDLMDSIDVDDLQVALWKNLSEDRLKTRLCTEWSSSCKNKNRNIKVQTREFDEIFEAKTDKEIEMDSLLDSMRSSLPGGGGLNMYTKDDLDESMKNMEL